MATNASRKYAARMGKKAKSPTGRPSKVNPDVAAAMAGKKGKRPAKPVVKKAKPKRLTDAVKMDHGMPLTPRKKK